MTDPSDASLLMIEPTSTVAPAPLIDALTQRMTAALRHATPSAHRYLGVHTATGHYPNQNPPHSDNANHMIICVDGKKRTSNSLAVHYLAYFRHDIPESELAKLDRVLPSVCALPTDDQLWPGGRPFGDRRPGARR